MAKVIVIVKAILTRIMFATHGFIAIWRAATIKKDPYYWYLSASILALSFEGIFTLTIKKNQEWKWFCPSVFLYLCSVVPPIWIIEVEKFDRKKANLTRLANANNTALRAAMRTTTVAPFAIQNIPLGNINIPGIGGVSDNLTRITADDWEMIIEQVLMLILIIGRWMLPKGGLTRDQLSQLLLVYIGTAADIIEFFDSFKDDKIAKERILCLLILSIWSWSLLQFTVVLTATKARRTRITGVEPIATPKAKLKNGIIKVKEVCCSIDVWAILINIILQDAPFMIFRVLLIAHYKIVSYMNIFFTCKNSLVIILQFYRLYVVQMEKKKEISKFLKANVSGNLVKAIGQAAFLGRQVEMKRAAASKAVAGSSRHRGGGPSSSRIKGASKRHRSQESISSRNTRYSDAPPRSDRVRTRRKSLSANNLRGDNANEEDYLQEVEDDLEEAGVSGSALSGTNDQDSEEDSGDVQLDDMSVTSERPRQPQQRRNIRMSENPGVYRISGSRSSQASSDRGHGHHRQDTGYSSSSRESGASSRRDRITRPTAAGIRPGRRSGNRVKVTAAQSRRRFLTEAHNVTPLDFLEIDIENDSDEVESKSALENERI